MSVEPEGLHIREGVEPPSDALRAKVDTVAAVGLFVVGLDLSGLSENELERLRFSDAVYLAIEENKRRFSAAVEIIRTMRLQRDSQASRIRGGPIGRAYNYLTSLNSDPHNQP